MQSPDPLRAARRLRRATASDRHTACARGQEQLTTSTADTLSDQARNPQLRNRASSQLPFKVRMKMKQILVLFAALLAFSVNAATLVPIQLLNPAGSSSGGVITSTGLSTAPAWNSSPPSRRLLQPPQRLARTQRRLLLQHSYRRTLSHRVPRRLPRQNIVGVTNGTNAAAGSVGEYLDGLCRTFWQPNGTTQSVGGARLLTPG